MDLGRLGKKARNELMRNPKKTAILAVICLVALYFWMPLLRGWVSGGTAKKPTKGAAKAEVVAATTVSPVAADDVETRKSTARAEAAYRWDKQVRQREQDPLMSPAAVVAETRNPFRHGDSTRSELAARAEEESDDETPAPVKTPVIERDPQELGLVLKGTLVGSRSSAATINSRTYRQGTQVVANAPSAGSRQGSGSPEGPIEFTLAEVRRDSVVLTRGDKSFTLEFSKPSLAPGNRVEQDLPETDTDTDTDTDTTRAGSEE